MIERKLDKYLESFYQTTGKALLLTGARQVGKTEAFRRFAKNNFENYIEINFIETPDASSIFEGARNAEDILVRLSTFTETPLVPGKTFILFDEVQKCLECITQIKFLVEEGSYTYGLTGSLLGVELNDVRSMPVGYMDIHEAFPLDFEDFAKAIGLSQTVFDALSLSYESKKPVDSVVHRQMLSLFNLYLIIGGMPAAVWQYLQTKNMQHVIAEQESILNLYKKDITQYDKDDKLLLDEIFSLIPSELNAKNKRFILKSLNEGAKFRRFGASFLWLKNSGVAIPVYNVEEPRYPLLLNKQRNLFKLFQNDVGLLACQYAGGVQFDILRGKVDINYGAIYENAVAQELLSHGFSNLYYFNSKKQGEVDFVIEKGDGTVLPIEVKSGKDYSVHHALDNILSDEQYNIKAALVLCNDNVSVKGKITYLPIYMSMFLQREQQSEGIYIPDISALV